MSGNTVEEWNAYYASGEYRQHWDYSHPSSELVTFVAAGSWPPGAAALDVGCGAGREAIFLAGQGFHVTGVDLSEEALRIARDRAEKAGVHVEWKQGNALELPVPDASVDLVNDRGCFHMIGEEDRPRYAAELARVLKPGGKVLLRGCREVQWEGQKFVLVTPEAVERHFSHAFDLSPVLPVQLITDSMPEGLNANLAVLRKK
ncbi:class I SAM-dependent methyltransferase [Kroppenstedtia eburnea]|uniref:class I SAM-dependent methyltransferase n=1 Tax=Kroppenstedtia eburnea TaxID=714067 RepID=UPI00020C8DC5|nr:2-heptaprenyl-1,4-naphthoquinone methyltransferase [Desmospora sp. 8437]